MINELRIGNWIYFVSVVMDEQYRVLKPGENPYVRKNPVRVQVSTFDKIEKSPENFAPIPLSPEILEACGFEKDYDGNYRFQIEQWVFIWLSEYEIFNIGRGAQLAEYTRIEKLHQLQNAVHALTGFELAINLEKVKV